MYNQEQKKVARKLALEHAVKRLTKRRKSSAVVPVGYVRKLREHLLGSEIKSDAREASLCSDETCESWERFWTSKIGKKQSNEIVVAYLAGPEPQNDFDELVRLGVHPHNIFAFESDKPTFNEALRSVKRSKYPLVKIISMPIERYLQAVPQTFDIIYFDACGPLPSNSQATLKAIANVFRYQRLSHLGALITNFSKPDVSDESQLAAYSDLISSYLYPKGTLESGKKRWNLDDGAEAHGYVPRSNEEGESFVHKVRGSFPDYYGQYITRQLFDLASFISPISRLSNTDLWASLFTMSPKEIVQKARGDDQTTEDYFDYLTEPYMDPLGWTMAELYDAVYEGDEAPEIGSSTIKLRDTWTHELSGSPQPKHSARDCIDAYNVVRNDYESDEYVKKSLRELLNGFDYMRGMQMFCDVPTRELSFFPVLSQYSFPYHYNVEATRRWTYCASGKSTEMFLDVIIFDTCRYVYDWLPSVELVAESFEAKGHQLAYRFAVDGIVKHSIRYNNEYLFGAHVVGVNHDGFTEKLLIPRMNIA